MFTNAQSDKKKEEKLHGYNKKDKKNLAGKTPTRYKKRNECNFIIT